jgi:hypothetical protein
VLEAIPYNENVMYVHTDTALMPKLRTTWASWNSLARCGVSLRSSSGGTCFGDGVTPIPPSCFVAGCVVCVCRRAHAQVCARAGVHECVHLCMCAWLCLCKHTYMASRPFMLYTAFSSKAYIVRALASFHMSLRPVESLLLRGWRKP